MTEKELIDTINALIDADVQAGTEMTSRDLARRAIEHLGEGVVAEGAVADLADQVFAARFEPGRRFPGAEPRLREVEGVARVAHKRCLTEMLHAGQQDGEPLEATVARMRRMYPGLTKAAMDAVIEAYSDWLRAGSKRKRRI